MSHYYSHLGAVPPIAARDAERRDELLAHTGNAAREILRDVNQQPVSRRVDALNRALANHDPQLPAAVHRVAQRLAREGMTADLAVERALTLALADSTIERFKAIGARRMHGGEPLGGLGGARDTLSNLTQKVACSDRVRRRTTTIVGRNEGATAATATDIGFDVVRTAADCNGDVPPPPPPGPAAVQRRSPVGPIMVGVGLLLVGGAIWVTMRK